VFEMIHGTKGLWYEPSIVRIVYGTNSLVIFFSKSNGEPQLLFRPLLNSHFLFHFSSFTTKQYITLYTLYRIVDRTTMVRSNVLQARLI